MPLRFRPLTALAALAVLAALCAPAVAWPSICWHELKNDYNAEPAVELHGPSCEEGNRLVFTRRSDGRIETAVNDSWGMFSDSHESCVAAEAGLKYYMDASSELIRKLNETGDVSLPQGLVFRQTLGGKIGFTGVGPRAYDYPGSCGTFQGKLNEFLDCHKRCKGLEGDAAQQMCGSDTRRTTCEKINGMESQDYLGLKEVDLTSFAKDMVTLGKAVSKNKSSGDK